MPGRKADSFSLYDDLLAAAPASDPWTHRAAETPAYEPDYGLLSELLTIPVRASALSESGIFAKGIDSWIAHELRRAGFAADEIWPRPQRPPGPAPGHRHLAGKAPRRGTIRTRRAD